ncbi:MAG: peptidoglycan recognition family protein [Planctomycetota bacterium]
MNGAPPAAGPRVPTALPLLLALVVLAFPGLACVSAPPAPPEPSAAAAAPLAWRTAPHTWQRLDAIEDWLVGPEAAEHPELVPEAELLLAEGRLRFATEEGKTLSAPALAARLDAAAAGFRRVLRDAGGDPAAVERAQRGLAAIEHLREGSAPLPAAAPTGILARAAWGASRAVPSNMTAAHGWSRITVHHSAVKNATLGRGSEPEVARAIQRIQKEQMRDRGFGDIGYHFLVDPTGRVWSGRSLAWQGAHARGSNNVGNIGVCLLGSFEEERPTPRALAALQRLLDDLCRRHRIARDRVYAHSDLIVTACPGRHLLPWVHGYQGGRIAATK